MTTRRIKAAWIWFVRNLSWLLLIGVLLLTAKVVPLSAKVADQARAGDAARQRQIKVAPGGCKVQQDAFRRGVITRDDMRAYSKGALSPCPIP